MDKNTLSNYGWIVIAVLVLSVMIALATPFGEYIKAGVESTTAGLFDTSEKALNVVGMSAQQKNNLEGKTLTIFGTSISISANTYVHTSYGENITEKYNMSLNDYAYGGDNSINMLNRFNAKKESLKTLSKDDIVIFEGFLNGLWGELGVLSPVGTTTFDTSTYIGALEEMIYQYQKSGCKAKVGVVLTHIVSTSSRTEEETLAQYNKNWDAYISVCEKYNVPYLDLRNKPYPLMNDGVHLTQEGQNMMATDVESWLKTL